MLDAVYSERFFMVGGQDQGAVFSAVLGRPASCRRLARPRTGRGSHTTVRSRRSRVRLPRLAPFPQGREIEIQQLAGECHGVYVCFFIPWRQNVDWRHGWDMWPWPPHQSFEVSWKCKYSPFILENPSLRAYSTIIYMFFFSPIVASTANEHWGRLWVPRPCRRPKTRRGRCAAPGWRWGRAWEGRGSRSLTCGFAAPKTFWILTCTSVHFDAYLRQPLQQMICTVSVPF